MPDVLVVVTSHDRLGDAGSTGVGLQTVSAALYALADAGATVSIASPLGGRPPVDPLTFGEGVETESLTRYLDDPAAVELFESSLPLPEAAEREFDGVYFAGGHGGMWDFPADPVIDYLIASVLDSGGYAAAVCHGVAALCGDRGVLKGRRVTGLTNKEELLLGRDRAVPFLLQDRLAELGGTFVEAGEFTSHVVVDGQVITGQNMRSADATAHALLEALAAKERP
ncbi:type 1 glutamine amidotransferase domain-containing protein [Phytomonospora sp. NPDC050363]|uniref:type 1 glutamine amidotransferase domain-containing protein n=1 Tax=Phytomonospora sp. NPDC050363 TaxID=3155642 RepID=UPI0033F47FAE